MKFLCRNCKAKYQIADEKVAGRTLRMTCQQCGEPIVVRGPARSSGSVAAARPVAPASVAAAPAALHGADLTHHMAAPAREPAVAHEEWHVAINDQPVGPLRRDEVARRIGQGAIDRESLAWREGMDDWLPIKHIAELSALFGTGPSHGGGSGALKLQQLSPAPSTRVDMAPIGGRQVVPAEEYAPRSETEPEPAPVAVATFAAAAEPAAAGGKQPGWAQMFALVSGGAFILAAGALLGVRVLAPSNQAAPTPPPAAVAPVAQPTAPGANANRPADGAGSVIELDTQAIDGQSTQGQRKSGATGAGPTAAANANDKNKRPLTAEQKEMLERMGGGLNQGPSNLRAPTDTPRGSSAQAGQLTSEQLSAVVLNGRKNLQRCYETALRGSNSNETVRLDVDIEVSPHGNVTSVHTAGKGLPGMEECITRTVKMWRFPMSGEATQTHFPVVFQPGA